MDTRTRRFLFVLAWPLALIAGACSHSRVSDAAVVKPATVAAAPAVFAAPTVPDLLAEMTAAVNAGDQARYLACVSQRDPVFAMEQKNWAKDLSRKRPEKFEVALKNGEDETPNAADGARLSEVTFKWTMPGARERSVSFLGRFEDDGGRWRFAGEAWKTLEAPGVRVFFFEGSEDAAKVVVDVFPGVRKHVQQVMGLVGDKGFEQYVQEVKLYKTMRHLQESIYLSYSDGLAGWNEPGESIKVLVSRGTSAGAMRSLLGHEYGHAGTFAYGPHANDMPWWILEGVAELTAERYTGGGQSTETIVRRWAENTKKAAEAKPEGDAPAEEGSTPRRRRRSEEVLIEWERLADFHGEAVQHQAQVYTQGHHMVRYIGKRFGDEKRIAWMRAMSVEKPATMDEATRRVLGMTFKQLDTEWRESLLAPSDDGPIERQ